MNNAAIQFQPRKLYPQICRLPGEKTPARLHLPEVGGTARRVITQGITWSGVTERTESEIASLAEERQIMGQNPLSRKYLAFTVYTIKQMTATGTISPEIAWTLFNMEWNGIQNEPICHENFIQRRADFFSSLKLTVNNKKAPVDLLEFEFWARAGEAGQKQFQKYYKWAEKLIFVRRGFKQQGEGIQEEYRKALWLEMRMAEDQIGIRGLNKDLGRMILLKEGAYFFKKKRTIGTTISLRSKEGIDTTIKAEMGHWLLELLAFPAPWIEELADRMNIMFDSPKVFAKAFSKKKDEELPPQARVARNGGYFLAARMVQLEDPRSAYPTYPDEFPKQRIPPKERHEVAEMVECRIRQSLSRAVERGEVKKKEALRSYRQIGLYVCLLKLQGKNRDEILTKIDKLDVKAVQRYARDWKQIAVPALERRLNHPSLHQRGMAAKALIHFRRRPKNSPAYRRLYAYQLIDQGSYAKLIKLGRDAIPALEALKKSRYPALAQQAQTMIEEIKEKMKSRALLPEQGAARSKD
jgi:hypothetical protein